MLEKLPKTDLVYQVLENSVGKIARLCKNITVISVACNSEFKLALYARINPGKGVKYHYEAGIVYLIKFPQDILSDKFLQDTPSQMLRFSSEGKHDCFDRAEKNYDYLVQKHNLAYMS